MANLISNKMNAKIEYTNCSNFTKFERIFKIETNYYLSIIGFLRKLKVHNIRSFTRSRTYCDQRHIKLTFSYK